VNIRGGKRQPRYYYHKERGAVNMMKYLEEMPKRSPVEQMIEKMREAAFRCDEVLREAKEKLK